MEIGVGLWSLIFVQYSTYKSLKGGLMVKNFKKRSSF